MTPSRLMRRASCPRGKARTAYQDFFVVWKDADPDIPILKQPRLSMRNCSDPQISLPLKLELLTHHQDRNRRSGALTKKYGYVFRWLGEMSPGGREAP